MSATAAIPTWKQALLDRKKLKDDEEKRKKEDEDAKLKSIPAWKRAMLQKKSTEMQPTTSKPKELKVSPDSGANSVQVKPSWQKEEQDKKPIVANGGPCFSRETQRAPSEELPRQVNGSHQSQRLTDVSSDTSIASGFVSKTAADVYSRSSAERIPPEDIPDSESSSTKSDLMIRRTTSPKHGSSPTNSAQVRDRSKSESFVTSKVSEVTNDEDDKHLDSLPAWRRELILRKRNKLKRTNTPPGTDAPLNSSGSFSQNSSTSSLNETQPKAQLSHQKEEKKLPPWKQQQQQQKAQQKPEPQRTTQQSQDKQKSHYTRPQHQAQERPQAVTSGQSSGSLKDQTSKSDNNPVDIKDMVPPAFKEVEPWANMSEDDLMFKSLPAWKQALILRRRDDYEKRSRPEEYLRAKELAENPPEEEEPDCPEHITTIWSPTNTVEKGNLRHVAREDVHKVESEEENIPPWKLDILRNQRLKAHLEGSKESSEDTASQEAVKHHQLPTDESSLDEDDDDMFTNIDDLVPSKKPGSHEDTDAVPALRKSRHDSSVSSLSSSGGSRSILTTAERRKSTSRRVSWNEDRIIEEFSYPKYDYRDYSEDLPDGVIDTTLRRTGGAAVDDSRVSQPIHPSLRPSSPPPGSPSQEEATDYGGGPTAASLSSYKPSILSTFASFGDPWSSGSLSYESSPPPKNEPAKKKEEEEEVPEEALPSEDYSSGGWDQNPGAILW